MKDIDDLDIGDKGSFSKTITETDVSLFAGMTGDFNPMHMNEKVASQAFFGERIAHGGVPTSLTNGAFKDLVGMGARMLETEVSFQAPTKIGDTITAIVEIEDKNIEENTLDLDIHWENQDDDVIGEGRAKVKLPEGKTAEAYKEYLGDD